MNKKKIALDYVILALGSILTALGVHFFKIPNNFSTGGFSGLGMLLGKLIQGLDTSTVISLLNIGSLVFGFIFLGKSLDHILHAHLCGSCAVARHYRADEHAFYR